MRQVLISNVHQVVISGVYQLFYGAPDLLIGQKICRKNIITLKKSSCIKVLRYVHQIIIVTHGFKFGTELSRLCTNVFKCCASTWYNVHH